MANDDPFDGFFYPTLTLMIDSYMVKKDIFIIRKEEISYKEMKRKASKPDGYHEICTMDLDDTIFDIAFTSLLMEC